MLLLAAAVCGTLGVHVHPGDPQPRLASRHPPARVLSRGRKGQETHAVQPHPLAPQSPGRLQGPAQGRNRHFGPKPPRRCSPFAARCRTATSPPSSAPCARLGSTASSDRTATAAATSSSPWSPRASPSPPPSSPPPRPSRPRPPPRASVRSWAWARSTRTSSTARSTGSRSARPRSKRRSPGGTCTTARSCSTTCPRATGRAAAANSPGWATIATARLGYNRDRKRGKLQIVYGLLCAPDGCPIAVEVFAGDTADPMTLSAQIAKLKERFGLAHVVLVGDRGLITQARIDTDLAPAGLDWITALRAPAICGLVEGGHLQLSLFDERDMAAITSPDYPGERLIVCRNPDLARERARKREDLLCATERDLAKVARAVTRAH